MRWTDVRATYPAQWLVIEAVEVHTEVRGDRCQRVLDQVEVLEVCADGRAAENRCRELRRAMPDRTVCFIHTSYPALEFVAARLSA